MLHMGDGFDVPLEGVTSTWGIFANKGRGKTVAAHVLAEETHNAGAPVVVFDVKGDWWGIRSSKNGKGPGLGFVIFGGEHADVPLEPTAGRLLAKVIVEQRISAVLDMSLMSKTSARRFAMEFAEEIYMLNREALLIIVDEADVLIPQRVTADLARLLGAMEDIAKRGRGRGLGLMIASQRPQEVAKSVTDLCDTLLLFGLTGPRAIKSIREWIEIHDESDQSAEVMRTLPSLVPGEAWLWSPSLLRTLRRVKVRLPETFDSHKTPKVGERILAPTARAELDLESLGAQIAATVEKAKADDPKVLHARIKALEAKAPPAPEVVEVEKIIERVPERVRLAMVDINEHVTLVAEKITALIAGIGADFVATFDPVPQAVPPAMKPPVLKAAVPAPSTVGTGDRTLTKAERAILGCILQRPGSAPTIIGFLSGYSPKSGGFRNTLSSLRTAGLIEKTQPLRPLPGAETAVTWAPLPSGPDLIGFWVAKLSRAERLIVEHLVGCHPQSVDKQALADATGYQATSGGFRNSLSHLRTMEIIDRNPEVGLHPEFVSAVGL